VDVWETKNHFLWLVAHNKAQRIYIEVCSNMIEKGYSLSAIAEIVPMVLKAEIYGLCHLYSVNRFFCLGIIKGSPNDIYCIIEEPFIGLLQNFHMSKPVSIYFAESAFTESHIHREVKSA